jgi:hypothetical protein
VKGQKDWIVGTRKQRLSSLPVVVGITRSLAVFVLAVISTSVFLGLMDLGSSPSPVEEIDLFSPARVSLPKTNLLSLSGDHLENLVVLSGDRGIIFRSDDWGRSYQEVAIPYPGLTTKVKIVSPSTILIGGHEGTILRSLDTGKSFEIVHQLEETDQPIFNFFQKSESHIFAVGAYSLILESQDRGGVWEPANLELDEEPHLYGALSLGAPLSTGVVLTGEFGSFIHWPDVSQSNFQKIDIDYEGSFFGVESWADRWWAFGLQGKLVSLSKKFTQIKEHEMNESRAIYGLFPLSETRAIVFGASGLMILINPEGEILKDLSLTNRANITQILALDEVSQLLLLGPQVFSVNRGDL